MSNSLTCLTANDFPIRLVQNEVNNHCSNTNVIEENATLIYMKFAIANFVKRANMNIYFSSHACTRDPRPHKAGPFLRRGTTGYKGFYGSECRESHDNLSVLAAYFRSYEIGSVCRVWVAVDTETLSHGITLAT